MTLSHVAHRQDYRINGPAWVDIVVVATIVFGGMVFLWDPRGWAPNVYVGNDQFGDAEFWWNGALQFSRAAIWNNLNITYRMGYAIFAGLLVAVLGPDYAVFHKVLVLLFLGVAASGYLILLARLGRLAALAMTAALVLSPYQAEWLAISTSDSLGLIWNLISLLSLVLALGVRLRWRWLAAAGIFLALGALTRPLMTLFIGPTVLFVLLRSNVGIRERCAGLTILVAAFALPMLFWTTTLYLKTGYVAAAGQQWSNLYTASNPRIQAWDSSMLGPVGEAAQARLGLPSVTEAQLSEEFRYQTLANYRDEWAYHLRRLPKHIFALARFTYDGTNVLYRNTNSSNHLDTILRWLVRGMLTITVGFLCFMHRRVFGAVLAFGVCALSLWPRTAGLVVVASATLCLLPWRNSPFGQIHRLISAYWWVGVVALYFVGGTWGPPLRPEFDIHPLGYRLGLQFLFANEWLVILAIVAVGGVPGMGGDLPMVRSVRPWTASATLVAAILKGARNGGVALLAGLLTIGAGIIGVRGWQALNAVPMPMPSITPILSAFCSGDGNRKPRSLSEKPEPASVLWAMWDDSQRDLRLQGAHIFTGGLGGLIWQLEEERRTRATLNQQDQYFPFIFSAYRTDIEFPALIDEASWRYRQGAWIIRNFRETGLAQSSVYYETLPKVQVFVPLSVDGQSFDTAKMVRFPVTRSAAALAYAGRLEPKDAQLEWMQYPTNDIKRRWFLLMPPEKVLPSRKRGVEIDTSDSTGQRNLSFNFRIEPLSGVTAGKDPVTVVIESLNSEGLWHTLIERASLARGIFLNIPTDHIATDIPDDAKRLRVMFSNLEAKEYVRIVEMQLTSLDVAPSLENEFCDPR